MVHRRRVFVFEKIRATAKRDREVEVWREKGTREKAYVSRTIH